MLKAYYANRVLLVVLKDHKPCQFDPDVAMPNTLNHIFFYLLIRVFFSNVGIYYHSFLLFLSFFFLALLALNIINILALTQRPIIPISGDSWLLSFF